MKCRLPPTDPGTTPVIQLHTERTSPKTSTPSSAWAKSLIGTTRFETDTVVMQVSGMHQQSCLGVVTYRQRENGVLRTVNGVLQM